MNKVTATLPSNRKFGLFFSTVFFILGLLFIFSKIIFWSIVFFILSLVFLLISLTVANILLPFNRLWMGIGRILGLIVNPIVLGLIFFFMFTPIGFFMRLFSRDELKLKFSEKDSYWNTSSELEKQISSFKDPF